MNIVLRCPSHRTGSRCGSRARFKPAAHQRLPRVRPPHPRSGCPRPFGRRRTGPSFGEGHSRLLHRPGGGRGEGRESRRWDRHHHRAEFWRQRPADAVSTPASGWPSVEHIARITRSCPSDPVPGSPLAASMPVFASLGTAITWTLARVRVRRRPPARRHREGERDLARSHRGTEAEGLRHRHGLEPGTLRPWPERIGAAGYWPTTASSGRPTGLPGDTHRPAVSNQFAIPYFRRIDAKVPS